MLGKVGQEIGELIGHGSRTLGVVGGVVGDIIGEVLEDDSRSFSPGSNGGQNQKEECNKDVKCPGKLIVQCQYISTRILF